MWLAAAAPGVDRAKDEVVVLGRLARAVRATNVRVAPRDDARVIRTIPTGASLAVRYGGEWLPVVMKDGSTAYVRHDAPERLDFPITRHGPPSAPSDSMEETARFARSALGGKAVAGGHALGRGVGDGEFVALAYRSAGRTLPDDPEAQAKVGDPVKRLDGLLPGDRLHIWTASEDRIAETALYVGDGHAVLADPKAGKVRAVHLDPQRLAILVAARR